MEDIFNKHNKKTGFIGMRIDPSLKNKLTKTSNENNISMSATISTIIANYYKQIEESKKNYECKRK